MRRTSLLLTFVPFVLLAGIATPATAQAERGQYRTRTVMVFGDDPCPKSTNPDEIIVCARRPEEDRYRIPKQIRDQEREEKIAREDDVSARRADLSSRRNSGASGIGSCSAAGGGGATGCTAGIDLFRAGKTVVEGVEKAIEPDD